MAVSPTAANFEARISDVPGLNLGPATRGHCYSFEEGHQGAAGPRERLLVSLEFVWSPVAVQDQTALTAWKCLGLPQHTDHPCRSHSTHFRNCQVHLTQCSCASTRSLTSNNCSVALTLQYIHTGRVRQHTIQSSCKTSARAAPGTSCCKFSAPAAQLLKKWLAVAVAAAAAVPLQHTLEQRLPPQTPAWRGPFNTRRVRHGRGASDAGARCPYLGASFQRRPQIRLPARQGAGHGSAASATLAPANTCGSRSASSVRTSSRFTMTSTLVCACSFMRFSR